MPPNINEVIDSLQKISTRIDSMNEHIQDLTNTSKKLYVTVKLSKEYNDELKIWNNFSDHNSRNSLISSLEEEMNTIKELENENQELKMAIQNYQQALGIIMEKYREQGDRLNQLNDLERFYQLQNDLIFDRHNYFQNKFNEMIPLMDNSCSSDQMDISNDQNLISELQQENKKQKKLLKINHPEK